MNTKYLFVVPLCCFLAACTKPGPVEPLDCEPYAGPTPPCNPAQSPDAPHVTLNSNSLNVVPWCVRARAGSEIVIKLVPVAKNSIGSAEIVPKNEADDWLVGTNDPDKDEIRIPVPEDLPEGDHMYGFVVGDECVDPRVHVEL